MTSEQVSPFVRLYPKAAPAGLYMQVQAGFYRHSVTYTYNTAGPGPPYTETERFSHSGLGAAVGTIAGLGGSPGYAMRS